MLRYCITDRRQAGGIELLLAAVKRNLERAVDMIQIREKDLPTRELASLTRQVCGLAAPYGTRVLVNERADVALACGAAGVHLPANSLPVRDLRAVTPKGFVIGVSCHEVEEVQAAARDGADFAVFGPVFWPLSKESPLPPRGLDGLRAAAHAVSIPVLALGGVTEENALFCVEAGAAGIAGITIFQRAS
jgi:thiamine-phosphate pyrophosphorylase